MRSALLIRLLPLFVMATTGAGHAQSTVALAEPESVLDRPARLAVADVPLGEALTALSRTSRVLVGFSPTLIGARSDRVSCACADLTVREALDRLLGRTTFGYSVMNGQVFIVDPSHGARDEDLLLRRPPAIPVLAWDRTAVPLGPARIEVQEGTITGRVADAQTGQPVVAAGVSIEGTGLGAFTGEDGRYAIRSVPAGTHTVRVQRIGFRTLARTVTVGAGGTAEASFELTQDAIALDAVVVTGTARADETRRSLGHVVAAIDADQMVELAPPQDMTRFLMGAVPGVRVQQAEGEIGAGASIRIRGVSSLSLASEPLIYVDGVRVNSNHADLGGGHAVAARFSPSRINDLNPNEIERIEIIKGPAASTLYGTEASNGVINIITKRGVQGRPLSLNAWSSVGASFLPDPEGIYASGFYRCTGTSAAADVPEAWKCAPGEITEFNVLRFNREVHGDEPFRTGVPWQVGASASGGTDELGYFVSAEYDRDEGMVSYNWQNKFTARANLDFSPSDELQLQFGMGGVTSRNRTTTSVAPITAGIVWTCRGATCEAGSGSPWAMDGPWRGYGGFLPESAEDDAEAYLDVDRLTYTMNARHQPLDWLSHRLNVGVDITDNRASEIWRVGGHARRYLVNGSRTVQTGKARHLSIDYAADATYEPLADLRLTTSVGLQHHAKRNEWVFSSSETFPVRSLGTLNGGTARFTEEDFLENKTLGLYVQEQVSWRDRLTLTAAIRGDDNSAFGRDYDVATYPKLSLSWVASDEPFFESVPLLNTLRLRSAWGQAGQQPDVLAALRTYSPVIGPGGAPGLTPQNIGNFGLEPEVGDELEVGFDAALLDDRVGVEFTYFAKRTKNALVQVPALPSAGFPGIQFRNLGEVSNEGFEIAVNNRLVTTRDVAFELGVNFSKVENEIVTLGGQAPLVVPGPIAGQYNAPGFPVASWFRKRVVSADIQGTGPAARAVNVLCEGGERVAGSNLSRGGGAPVPCSQAPEVFMGAPVPTWTGSVSGTLTLFRDLQLFGLVDYMGGHILVSGDVAAHHTLFNSSRAILERTDPILLGYLALGGEGTWQPGLFDAGLARLRTVSLSYQLPDAWAARTGASSASLTLTGNNVWTAWQAQQESWGVRQPDIEVSSNAGTGLGVYHQEGWPQLRRFMATLRVAF